MRHDSATRMSRAAHERELLRLQALSITSIEFIDTLIVLLIPGTMDAGLTDARVQR